MSDLAKLLSDIRDLTKAKADKLIDLLGARSKAEDGFSANAIDDLTGLNEEDWLIAEAISLKAEAAALSRSLDETLDYVRSRCAVVLAE